MKTACADRELALQAMLDGELDALSAAGLEQHLQRCAGCREAYARMEQVRSALQDADLRFGAPPALRASIEGLAPARRAAEPVRGRGAALPWLGGGVVGALAASLAILLAVPQAIEPGVADEVVSGQIRSLQSGHLVDVATSDRHTVKPWFNGRIDYSPPVVDLAARGFPLVGGRLDVLEGRTVAALVYKRRLHTINLYVRPAPAQATPGGATMRDDGYSVDRWTDRGLEYWAVSDIPADELRQFGEMFRAST